MRPGLLVFLVLVSACFGSGSSTSSTTPTSSPPSSTVDTTVDSTDDVEPEFDADEVPALALFLATIERGLEGSGLEGAAFEEPESLINTGVLFCALLDEEVGPVDIMRGWVAALSSEGATPSEDDLLLGGVVLGAAVQFICPEHLDELEL